MARIPFNALNAFEIRLVIRSFLPPYTTFPRLCPWFQESLTVDGAPDKPRDVLTPVLGLRKTKCAL
ncbi:hypothetical protein Lmac_2626 [Legionella maceachernii]|uniref:Uncharacterized protein n=1 Tax=Legionella maceachernii TaxID=466 RepID=A0A0W0VWF2_9GAMM|nr:hypothetical protein Lmac_2626 [Legionella maceachernii]SJZ61993.1 hypothetical protein SAMN02745128_00617 [Legionella maceachernii]SUP00941.1 Uncharacterised protein [Legionella maceachernii]